MVIQKRVLALLVGTALATSACGKKTEDDAEEADEGSGGVNGGGGQVIADNLAGADDVSDLRLTGLAVNLPASFGGQAGSALALTAAKRSAEACMMGQSIKEVTRRLGSVANFACHIEAEKDRILFGRRYRIMFQGQEFGRIYVEKTEGSVNYAFCGRGDDEGATNSELISVTGVSDAGPVGSVRASYSSANGTSLDAVDFDLTVPGVKNVSAKQQFSHDDSVFRRFVSLLLQEGSVSNASLAASGDFEGQSFAQRGASKFDGQLGSALFQNSGTHQGSDFSWSNRSYFNSAGEVQESSSNEAFAEGGALFVAATDVPQFLTASDAIPTADGWVATGCAEVDEDIELDLTSAAHQACEEQESNDHPECWGPEFEQGTQSQDL